MTKEKTKIAGNSGNTTVASKGSIYQIIVDPSLLAVALVSSVLTGLAGLTYLRLSTPQASNKLPPAPDQQPTVPRPSEAGSDPTRTSKPRMGTDSLGKPHMKASRQPETATVGQDNTPGIGKQAARTTSPSRVSSPLIKAIKSPALPASPSSKAPSDPQPSQQRVKAYDEIAENVSTEVKDVGVLLTESPAKNPQLAAPPLTTPSGTIARTANPLGVSIEGRRQLDLVPQKIAVNMEEPADVPDPEAANPIADAPDPETANPIADAPDPEAANPIADVPDPEAVNPIADVLVPEAVNPIADVLVPEAANPIADVLVPEAANPMAEAIGGQIDNLGQDPADKTQSESPGFRGDPSLPQEKAEGDIENRESLTNEMSQPSIDPKQNLDAEVQLIPAKPTSDQIILDQTTDNAEKSATPEQSLGTEVQPNLVKPTPDQTTDSGKPTLERQKSKVPLKMRRKWEGIAMVDLPPDGNRQPGGSY
jgi:hypothetical protein